MIKADNSARCLILSPSMMIHTGRPGHRSIKLLVKPFAQRGGTQVDQEIQSMNLRPLPADRVLNPQKTISFLLETNPHPVFPFCVCAPGPEQMPEGPAQHPDPQSAPLRH